MYIINDGFAGYNRYGEQIRQRGWFLILMDLEQPRDSKESISAWMQRHPPRAILRKVALKQCGHFMMGCARINNHSLILSGAYGNDGLPKSVPMAVYKAGIPLPKELYDAWAKGGGWNGCGTEARAMRDWAIQNWRKLVPVGYRGKSL